MPRLVFLTLFLTGCSLSPGMHMTTNSSWLDENEYVYIDSIQKEVKILNINDAPFKTISDYAYKIGIGDQIAVTVWGLSDIFPVTNLNPDQNLRRVDSNGNIFFPYAGLISAENKTQDQLREDLTSSLKSYFNDPQVDLKVAKFNSQRIFVLGEVTKPLKINLSDIPVSLSDAISESFGLNTNTASGSEVYIIRQGSSLQEPYIYYADLSSPTNFIDAGKFFLQNNDIVYVNASGTSRWNKVISQFFPFSTFLNSIDNLNN